MLVMDCCLARTLKFNRCLSICRLEVMMRTVERLAQLDDQISFLVRVIVRIACGYSVEANPKYIRDVIAVV